MDILYKVVITFILWVTDDEYVTGFGFDQILLFIKQ